MNRETLLNVNVRLSVIFGNKYFWISNMSIDQCPRISLSSRESRQLHNVQWFFGNRTLVIHLPLFRYSIFLSCSLFLILYTNLFCRWHSCLFLYQRDQTVTPWLCHTVKPSQVWPHWPPVNDGQGHKAAEDRPAGALRPPSILKNVRSEKRRRGVDVSREEVWGAKVKARGELCGQISTLIYPYKRQSGWFGQSWG